MSITEVASEISDHSFTAELESRFSFSNMPVCDWVVYQLAQSYFRPNCELRPIEDKGSIADSLTAAKIDIFDVTPFKQNFFVTILKTIAIFPITALIPIFSLAGICYHGYLVGKHVIESLKEGAKPDHNWEKIQQYACSLIADIALIFLCFAAGMIVHVVTRLSFISSLLFPILVFSGGFGWYVINTDAFTELLSVKGMMLDSAQINGAYKSIILRNMFGIVSAKDQELLTWDPKKDEDALTIQPSSSIFISTGHVEAKGYFANLYIKQGKEFLDLLLELKKQLPENCNLQLSYPPTADKVADFLDKNQIHIESVSFNIEKWKQKFYALDSQLKLIRDLIAKRDWREDLFSGSWSQVYPSGDQLEALNLGFPLTEQDCLAYLEKEAT